ncbi:MAG: hypothetical protein WDM92_14975 [Caulobacteraceae bacterium]
MAPDARRPPILARPGGRGRAHRRCPDPRARAPRLSASPAWPAARPLLYALLGYRKARAMADAVAGMGGREAMDPRLRHPAPEGSTPAAWSGSRARAGSSSRSTTPRASPTGWRSTTR